LELVFLSDLGIRLSPGLAPWVPSSLERCKPEAQAMIGYYSYAHMKRYAHMKGCSLVPPPFGFAKGCTSVWQTFAPPPLGPRITFSFFSSDLEYMVL
jgi:hypothetical protein